MARVKYVGINNQGIPDTRVRSENLASAPTADGIGHRFFDTALGYERVWNGTVWLKATVTGIVDVDVAAGAAIAETKLSLASDAAAGTASRRTLGTGALQAVAGNDARLTDARNPIALSVVDASVSATAAIAESKLNLASDAAAATASRRTLAYTGNAAMPGIARLDQIAVPTAAVSFNGQRITSLSDPTGNTDAATMQWVNNQIDLKVSAQDWKASVRAASTANVVIASGLVNTTVIDGITLATGDRVLLKNQTAGAENGIYIVVATGAAARSTDADNSGGASEVTAGMTVPVEGGGTANGGTIWLMSTAGAIVLGTTALTFVQIGAGGSAYSAGTGLTLTGNQFSISTTYVGQTSIVTLGTVTTGVWNGTAIAVANGGTGATTAAAARTNLAATGKFAATLGALAAGTGVATAHGLGTADLVVVVRDVASGAYVEIDVLVDATNITVTSAVAVAASTLRIVAVG